jgi:hypothetical protein
VSRSIPPSPSNPFARALAKPQVSVPRLRFAAGVALTLLLSGCFTLALFFLGALIVRGVLHHDYRALGAFIAAIALIAVMARRRSAPAKPE